VSRGIPIPPQAGYVNRLEFEMATRGLTVSELARRTGLSPDTVSRASKGAGITTGTALRISAAVYAEPTKPELVAIYGARGAA
jgi:transcriptional regulator with XRE-family HTH domain